LNDAFAASGPIPDWPRTKNKYHYYNAGVMLFSHLHRHFFNQFDMDELKAFQSVRFFEQTYFNYLIMKHNVPVQNIDCRYNYMEMQPGFFFGEGPILPITPERNLPGYLCPVQD